MPPGCGALLARYGRFLAIRMRATSMRWIVAFCAILLATTRADAQQVNLTKWISDRPSVDASVVDGAIRMGADPGWVRTTPAFLDFVLRLQFRPMTADADGAVLIRAYALKPREGPGVGLRISLPEAAGTDVVPNMKAFEGTLQDAMPPTAAAGKPVGEWRALEIRAEGTRITISIDGAIVRTGDASVAWAGYVGLQTTTGVMEFRDVTIERLAAGHMCENASLMSAGNGSTRSGLAPERGNGVVSPKLLRSVKPRYTPDAIGAAKQGVVRLEGVVLADGTVGDVCVRRPLDADLDMQAVAAARGFQFVPGTRDGAPVAVLVSFEIEFKLNK